MTLLSADSALANEVRVDQLLGGDLLLQGANLRHLRDADAHIAAIVIAVAVFFEICNDTVLGLVFGALWCSSDLILPL